MTEISNLPVDTKTNDYTPSDLEYLNNLLNSKEDVKKLTFEFRIVLIATILYLILHFVNVSIYWKTATFFMVFSVVYFYFQ